MDYGRSNSVYTMSNIVLDIERTYVPDSKSSPYNSIFKEYERVVIESLITSFGLDFLINDQHGGDVDTIHNVRSIGSDANMKYKNTTNEAAYNGRGDYSYAEYHSDTRFRSVKRAAKERYNATGEKINDSYTGKKNLEPNKASSIPINKQYGLDHIVECKAIHDDRGRVLSGLQGVDLANQPENLAFTNKSLNSSMGKWAEQKNARYRREHGCDAPLDEVGMEAYLREYPQSPTANPEIIEMISDSDTRQRMLSEYNRARKAYDRRIERAYYTSSSFLKDTAKASAKVGVKMGLRQALGIVFYEIWAEAKNALSNRTHNGESLFKAIGNGIKKGLSNAKNRHKDLWTKFIEGTVAGILSSLTTTLCNIFFSTAKSIVKIIRQSWASLVQAVKVLLFNPDCLPFGERFRAGAKILATGASVVVGTTVGEMVAKTGVGTIPVVGNIVSTFCGTLVTGIMSCSLLYLLDKNSIINAVVELLNKIPTVSNHVRYYRQQAALLESYCAELMSIDLDKFRAEIQCIQKATASIINARTENELNYALRVAVKEMNISLPYDESVGFDTFMGNRNNTLVFK